MDPSSGISLTSLFADFGMIIFAFLLVLLNGFFVAAEFAMVKLRAPRVETIASQPGWRASSAFSRVMANSRTVPSMSPS